MRATVALTTGAGRFENITGALRLIRDRIDLQGRHDVLVKPNCVSATTQLASTHRDALCAVLAFVRQSYDGPLTIAEGAAFASTWDAFELFDYVSVARMYQARLVDLNADSLVPVQVYDRRLRRKTLHLARTVVNSDFRISLCLPKTHDTVLVTLSLKNMIMGALPNRLMAGRQGDSDTPDVLSAGLAAAAWQAWRRARAFCVERARARLGMGSASDKLSMHQGYPVINLNLALLAPWVRPHLAVVDGFAGIEGNGPVSGDPVDWRIALAGTDALAVDCLTAHLMGVNPAEVGYLSYCGQLGYGTHELGSIDVVGNADPQTVRRIFRPHPGYAAQRMWHLLRAEGYLAAGYSAAASSKPEWETAA